MTALEIKDVVDQQLKQRDDLEDELPSFIIIGPFYIITDTVRQNLSKKRKALANACIEMLARKLRNQSDEVLSR